MTGKTNVETPAPTMADVIRNRAYQLWGVQTESPSKTGGVAKKAAAGKTPAAKAAKSPAKAKTASAKRR